MSRFQKPYTRWLFSLCSIGLVVCLVYAAVVAAHQKGPKELKLGFVDFFCGAACLASPAKTPPSCSVDKWNKEGGIKGVPVKIRSTRMVAPISRSPSIGVWCSTKRWTPSCIPSSANCLAIAPLAEEQTLTVVHISTRRPPKKQAQIRLQDVQPPGGGQRHGGALRAGREARTENRRRRQ